jgi:hypothetical protein
MRVVRLRPGLVFKREAARRSAACSPGPFLPNPLVRRALVPASRAAAPALPGRATPRTSRRPTARARATGGSGAYNIAADPPLDARILAEVLGASRVPLPAAVVRSAALATFKLRLQPTEPGWLDMGLGVPLMDTRRAQRELGWEPRRTACRPSRSSSTASARAPG